MAIIVFVAFEIGICPGYSQRSDNLSYGTKSDTGFVPLLRLFVISTFIEARMANTTPFCRPSVSS